MSSNSFSACLTPDPWLRITVLISGRVLIAAGLVLILTLELGSGARAVMGLLWLATGRFELRRIERGFESYTTIRIGSDGAVSLLDHNAEWVPATLQSGSMVLQHFAWLRLKTVNGEIIVELLRGDTRTCHQWRRFQVIWQHLPSANGTVSQNKDE